MLNGGKQIHLKESDITDWTITFVDTGLKSNIGQRLKAVEKYLEGEEMFLANYADGVNGFTSSDNDRLFHTEWEDRMFHLCEAIAKFSYRISERWEFSWKA